MNFKDFKLNGYQIVKNNFFNINKSIQNEFDHILNNSDNNHTYKGKIYKNIKILNNFDNLFILNNLFNLIKNCLVKNNFDLIFEDVWFQKSDIKTYNKKELPFIPHIDKSRKFKVMFYINNIYNDMGPIYLKKTNLRQLKKYEDLRKSLSDDYVERRSNIIEDTELNCYEPMTGDFGSLVFFDTNTPHFAGNCSNKKDKRKILRFNFKYKN